MRIALNALSARTGGGVSVFMHLLPIIAKCDKKNSYVIFFSRCGQKEIADAIPEGFIKVAIDYLPQNAYLRILWEQIIFPFYLLFYRIDVLYSVGSATSILAPCKIVLFMENDEPHSLLDIKWSMRLMKARKILLKYLGWLSVKRANIIRFASYNSKEIFARMFKIPSEKCVVISHGYCDKMREGVKENKICLPENYILAVGLVVPHKNFQRLIEAFDILIKKYHYHGNLVIVGDLYYYDYFIVLKRLTEQLGLQKRIIFTNKVVHKEIAGYYAATDAFVMPSVEETFGIPLLEAMAIGTPIVAADCEKDERYRGRCFNPFKEICGDAAYYFNPFDVEDMAQAMHSVIINTELRNQLIGRGKERVQKYNLEDTARALVRLFENVYNS